MPWLLLLHIIFLICWCGSLLYLPALIHGSIKEPFTDGPMGAMRGGHPRIPRWVFTLVATPSALLAIAAGTAVFLADRTIEFWLLAKLLMVSALVIGHMLMGLLIARAEQGEYQGLSRWCIALGTALSLLMVSILWLVLNKPLLEAF